MVLKWSLDDWTPPQGSILLQYVDDLLLCSESQGRCESNSEHRLASEGHLVSCKKIWWCRSQVEYLGCIIKQGERLVSPARVKVLTCLSPPKEKAALLSFLGSIVYCRQRIPDCSHWDSILRAATLLGSPKMINWTEEMLQAFTTLTASLSRAPALGLTRAGSGDALLPSSSRGLCNGCKGGIQINIGRADNIIHNTFGSSPYTEHEYSAHDSTTYKWLWSYTL